MKKYVIFALSLLAMSTLVLTGCGKQDAPSQTPPASQPEISEPAAPDTDAPQTDSLMSVAELLGQADSDVKDLFDGGTENMTEDGSTLLGRTYSTTIDENAVTLETVYTEDKTVSSLSMTFTDKTADEVKEIMTAAFGEPETTDETQAMDTKYVTWTKDHVVAAMNESYGMSIVEFTLVNN